MEKIEDEIPDYFKDCTKERKQYILRKIAEAKDNEDGFTLSALHVKFFVGMVGEYLGDSCVQLVCLSATMEMIAQD